MLKRCFYFWLVFLQISMLTTVYGKGMHSSENEVQQEAETVFIENKGQWVAAARYKADISGGALFITDRGFVYHFIDQGKYQHLTELFHDGRNVDTYALAHHAYKVNFVGANLNIDYKTEDKKSSYRNYFIGKDSTQWAGRVGLYGKVRQNNIYKGIDLVMYSDRSALKYDFVVAPGADPDKIILSFEGVHPELTEDGDLLLKTTVNEVIEKAPFTYQVIGGATIPVMSKYKLQDGQLSFEFPGGYDKQYPLIIDPTLIFSTYSGGRNNETFFAHSSTFDKEKNMYAGALASMSVSGWPVTIGAFQATGLGGASVAINKYDPAGARLIYSTYYGGAGKFDVPHAMRVNDKNELIIVGSTNSSDLPTTSGAFSRTLNGDSADIFVVHFNVDGTNLIGATYIGGIGNDPMIIDMTYTAPSSAVGNFGPSSSPCELDFDANGNIWVVSNSYSTDFPVTSNALQGTNAGGLDGVLFQLDPACSNLMYSTYLGGRGHDGILNLAFNSLGNIVICGATQSSDFPTTQGSLHATAPGGNYDGFVAVINPGTSTIMNATFLGTAGKDVAAKLQIDCMDNIFVLGRTEGDYPISPGVWSMPGTNVFIDKLNPTLSTSLLSTRLGSLGTSFLPTALALDICGNIFVAGVNTFIDKPMPLTPDAFDATPKNFWFCALKPNFSGLLFGTYFGGPDGAHTHQGTYRFDPHGIVYHSVCVIDQSFPTTPGSWSPTKLNGGTNDIVSFKFDLDAISIDLEALGSQGANDTAAHCVRGCKSSYFNFTRKHRDNTPLTIHYLIEGSAINGVDYERIADSITIAPFDTLATLEIKPLRVPNPTGVNEVIIKALSPCGCPNNFDNIVRESRVFIYDSLYARIITPFDTICPNTQVTIVAESDPSLNFEWQPLAFITDPFPLGLTIHVKPVQTITYTLTATQPGAPATCPPGKSDYTVTVEPIPQIRMPTKDTTICLSDSLDLSVSATPGNINYSFLWSPALYLRDDSSVHNKFFAPPGDYSIVITATTPWASCSNKDSMMIRVKPPFRFTSVLPADTTIKYGDEIELEAKGEAVLWLWSPGTYLNNPHIPDPMARPLEPMVYSVIGFDKDGCKDTGYVRINIDYRNSIGIPTAFSPNGDGLNDVFTLENIKFEKLLLFRVFDRYGHQVFETTEFSKGWDGMVNGMPAALGVYYYQIKLVLPDGTSRDIKGDITLIR